MDNFQQFIVKSKYCRWNEEINRRETWLECVDRYYTYMESRFNLQGELEDIREATFDREVFPSMRALMTAGPAADVDDVCMYNCSYIPILTIRSFSDVMYVL